MVLEALPPLTGTPSTPDAHHFVISQLKHSLVYRDYHRAFETSTCLPLELERPGSFQTPLHSSKRLNGFCALMARRNRTCAACLQLQDQVEHASLRQPTTVECFAGLSESAVPVVVGDNLVGHLHTGQVFLSQPSRARFQAVLRLLNMDTSGAGVDELEAAYFETRVVPSRQYESTVRLLAVFALHLAALGRQYLAAASEMPILAKARAFIAEHQGEELHLNDVARAANVSAYYFCKLFRRLTGETFTGYLARMRVDWVKRRLEAADVRVRDLAYEAGFQSLSQFNRVFRRLVGESPTVYRDRLHGPSRS